MAPLARRRGAAAPLVALALLPSLTAAGDKEEHRKVALGYSSRSPSRDNSSDSNSSGSGGARSQGSAAPAAGGGGARGPGEAARSTSGSGSAPSPRPAAAPAPAQRHQDGQQQGARGQTIFCNPHTKPAQLCPRGAACPDCGGKRCACLDADEAPSGAGRQPLEPVVEQPPLGGPGLPSCHALPNNTVLLPEEAGATVAQVAGAIPAGTSVEVSCAAGFNGSRGSWNATCQASGEWLTEANCSLLGCPPPEDPLGVWRWRGSGHDQILELSCTEGFVQSFAMPLSSLNCSVLGAGDDALEPPRCVPGCCDGDEEWRAALRAEAIWSLAGLGVAVAAALALPLCWGGRPALAEKLAALSHGSDDAESLFE